MYSCIIMKADILLILNFYKSGWIEIFRFFKNIYSVAFDLKPSPTSNFIIQYNIYKF